jgi:hypothetical protein
MNGASITRQQHFLKTDPDMWDATADGRKTAEFRKNDRDFQVEDLLILKRETFDGEGDGFRYLYRIITHIVRGPDFSIPEGFAMLSVQRPREAVTQFDLRDNGIKTLAQCEAIMQSELAKRHWDIFQQFQYRMATPHLLTQLEQAQQVCLDLELDHFLQTLPPEVRQHLERRLSEEQ